jgi:hypothetical protein
MDAKSLFTDYTDFTDGQITARGRPSAVPYSMTEKTSDGRRLTKSLVFTVIDCGIAPGEAGRREP